MPDVSLLAVLVSAAVAFVLGGAYYGLLGSKVTEIGGADTSMPPWKVGVEVLRCLVLAAVVAGLVSGMEVTTWWGGLALGAALWVGFPLVLWIGAVVHEGTPFTLAAIHAGDWLVKLLAIGTITSLWG